MPLWSNTAAATSAPKYHILATSAARGNTMYANTFMGQFTPGQIVGEYAANTSIVASNHKLTHAGWVTVKTGTGPVANITISTIGAGYANSDVVNVTPFAGGNVATANVVTYANGSLQTVTLINPGQYFVGGETVSVANSTGGVSVGTGATFTVTYGGRSGRKTYETMVAAGAYGGTPSFP